MAKKALLWTDEHTPEDFPRSRVLRRAADTVTTGGLLLIVDHASIAPWTWNQEPRDFPSPDETLSALGLDESGWTRIRVEAAERQATGPNGETATVTDNIIAIERHR